MSVNAQLPATQKRWIWPGSIDGIDGPHLINDKIQQPGAGEGALEEDLTPGSDPVGVVVAVGPTSGLDDDVTWKAFLGDKGTGMKASMLSNAMGANLQGTLMEYRTFPATSLVRLPNSLSFTDAASYCCAGVTAYNALFGGFRPFLPGETVLLMGTGGVSLFGAQIARASGARLIIISSSDDKLAEVKTLLGAVETINYKSHPNWHERVLEITEGRGADIILEVGGKSLPKSIKAVAVGGTVSVIGFLGGFGVNWNDSIMELMAKGCTVRGIPVGTRQQHLALIQLFELHNIKPVINKTFQFNQVKEALKTMEKQDFLGKIVIQIVAETAN
ncbi:NAD(P)-binding protein [Auriculariales sp. MPI-PUGE-AT-0066]|nr:NAD(P)-binding protein [Auriculariales sp. MPI-PUGE-AT-0066]